MPSRYSITQASLIAISLTGLINCGTAHKKPSSHKVIDPPSIKYEGRTISRTIKSLIDNKLIDVAQSESLTATIQRNQHNLESLIALRNSLAEKPLIGARFNRKQQKQLLTLLNNVLNRRESLEEAAKLTHLLYENSVKLYQCNSSLMVELRANDPSAAQIAPLARSGRDIHTIKYNTYDFAHSEFKAWSKIRATEVILNSLYEDWLGMAKDKKSFLYIERPNKSTQALLNTCLYHLNTANKSLQDILFNYEALFSYSQAIKAIRKLYASNKTGVSFD